jgi:hypothetical protein
LDAPSDLLTVNLDDLTAGRTDEFGDEEEDHRDEREVDDGLP